MRLLRQEPDGDFSLVEFYGTTTPPYAILSHTWGADKDEVSFKDIIKGRGRDKAGYGKIIFCAKQAARDGLRYFWIDTCNIDKSSSAELTEAINSMFQWYQKSAVCYVYLADVSVGSVDGKFNTNKWKKDFEKSKWFTRGWTLQELLAPASVEFFSAEGKPLGSKESLVDTIHKVTKISVGALRGQPLQEFSVEERLSWAADRQTKREEDAVYSLLGLLDLHMPLIYGEGRKNAFKRLHRELASESDGILYGIDKKPLRSPLPLIGRNVEASSARPYDKRINQDEIENVEAVERKRLIADFETKQERERLVAEYKVRMLACEAKHKAERAKLVADYEAQRLIDEEKEKAECAKLVANYEAQRLIDEEKVAEHKQLFAAEYQALMLSSAEKEHARREKLVAGYRALKSSYAEKDMSEREKLMRHDRMKEAQRKDMEMKVGKCILELERQKRIKDRELKVQLHERLANLVSTTIKPGLQY